MNSKDSILRLQQWAMGHKYWIGSSIVGVMLLLLVLSALVETLVDRQIRSQCELWKLQKGISIAYDHFEMSGFTEFHIQGLSLSPIAHDTLLYIKQLDVKMALLPLLILQPNIARIEVNSAYMRFVKRGGYCNYDFLFASDSQTGKNLEPESRMDIAGLLNRIFDMFFRFTPDRLNINDLHIASDHQGYRTQIEVKSTYIADHKINASIHLIDSIGEQHWVAAGSLHKKRQTIEGSLQAVAPEDTIRIPYLDQVYDAKVMFRSMSCRLKVGDSRGQRVTFGGEIEAKGLRIHYWRLAPTDIIPDNLSIDFSCTAGSNYIEMDSSTTIRINKVAIHPYIQLRKERDFGITIAINQRKLEAQTLLESMPKGIFSTISQVKLDGELDWRFRFNLDLDRPDDLILESSIDRHTIEMVDMGRLTLMNAPFCHTAYVRENPVRTFTVGPENPHYRALNEISPLLQNAVLQSEDGQFYGHLGFQTEAIREALIHDIKVGKFARGGSTISMQLVKNVFLNRNKNLFRKLEEAAIVWLIENKRITSKSRMLEVYLNIIEWGPMVYGAQEAAMFYFDKSAADLTLQECLFLSSIIPNPSLFCYAFDRSTGNIKDNRIFHFRQVAARLAKSGLISEQQAIGIIPDVKLLGPAKSYLNQSDTTRSELDIDADTLFQ